LRLRGLQRHHGRSTIGHAAVDGPTFVSSETRRHIVALPGQQLDRRGLLAGLPAMNDLQRSHSVAGSVGQLGDARVGKRTVLLAQLVNTDESLFVVDPFNNTAENANVAPRRHCRQVVESQFQQFAAIAGCFDLNVLTTSTTDSAPRNDRKDDIGAFFTHQQSAQPSKLLYVHRGTPFDWNEIEGNLTAWNFPQFRLVVMETTTESTSFIDAMSLRARLDLAVCLLRDGGLIGFDVSDGLNLIDVESSRNDDVENDRNNDMHKMGVAESLVSGFLERHGTDIVAPLV